MKEKTIIFEKSYFNEKSYKVKFKSYFQPLKGEDMSESVKEFTSANFNTEVLESDTPVLVDFWAEWCGPCRVIAPVVDEIATEYSQKVKVGKLNVDNENQIASQFGVRSIPALLIFKNGTVANQIVGAVPKNKITEILDSVI